VEKDEEEGVANMKGKCEKNVWLPNSFKREEI
jgi:hypothetical protein